MTVQELISELVRLGREHGAEIAVEDEDGNSCTGAEFNDDEGPALVILFD